MPEPIKLPSEADMAFLSRDREIAALKGKLSEAEKTAKRHLQQLELVEEKFEQLAAIREERPIKRLAPVVSSGQEHLGVGIAIWSDWHIAEVVDPSKIHGMNKFTPEIAKKRAEMCANSTVKVFKHLAKSYKMDTLFLFLGGDFITGYLHEELAQTNAMGPIEESIYAMELLKSGLEQVASQKEIKRLVVVCMRGNHGRTTKKMQYKNDFETSMESFIYSQLEHVFAGRIEIHIPRGDVVNVDAAKGFSIRCYHGHQVRYNDGLGGIAIPLNKWQAKQDMTERAQYNLMGHYHNHSFPNGKTMMCGALKGWDEYAASHGFPYQPPLQSFALLDVRRKMIAQQFAIFCE